MKSSVKLAICSALVWTLAAAGTARSESCTVQGPAGDSCNLVSAPGASGP